MPAAKACLVALAVGVLVGAIYGLLGVRSPAMPDRSPARRFGGYGAWRDAHRAALPAAARRTFAPDRGCGCTVHRHRHTAAWSARLPIAELKSFWGALGCGCWAA